MAAQQSTAWDQVSERFETLGAHLRDRFDEVGADATADREAFEKSLRTLASAIEDTLTAAGRAVRDPVLRRDLTSLATSLREALVTTFESVRSIGAPADLRERLAAPVRRGRSALGVDSAKATATRATKAATSAATKAASAASTTAASTKAAASRAAGAATATGSRTVSRAKTTTGTTARKAAPRKAAPRKAAPRKAAPRTPST